MLQFGHELNNLHRTQFLNMCPCEGALRVAASDWSSLSFMQNAVWQTEKKEYMYSYPKRQNTLYAAFKFGQVRISSLVLADLDLIAYRDAEIILAVVLWTNELGEGCSTAQKMECSPGSMNIFPCYITYPDSHRCLCFLPKMEGLRAATARRPLSRRQRRAFSFSTWVRYSLRGHKNKRVCSS